MILEVLRHGLALVKAFLNLGVSDVAAYDNGAVERETGGNGIFGEFGQNLVHGTVEVDFHDFTFAGLAVFLGN